MNESTRQVYKHMFKQTPGGVGVDTGDLSIYPSIQSIYLSIMSPRCPGFNKVQWTYDKSIAKSNKFATHVAYPARKLHKVLRIIPNLLWKFWKYIQTKIFVVSSRSL